MDAKRVEELQKRYGEVYEVEVRWTDESGTERSLTFVCKRPSIEVVDRFVKEVGAKPSQAIRNFVASCMVEPSYKDMEDTFKRYPGVYMTLANKLNDILGFGAEAVIKNLKS